MKIVIAPDKFKDCLPATDVAHAIARGIHRADPNIEIDICPMADGGEGTVDAMVAATGGRYESARVTGPLPDMRVDARFGVLGDGKTAVLEMSSASGLHLLKPEQRNPLRTTTFGTGELIRAAASVEGIDSIIPGIGGSATTDGGLGCAQACGSRITLSSGEMLTRLTRPFVGADLFRTQQVNPRRDVSSRILIACDVSNPLTGPTGAARIFGPQKGASPADVEQLDAALTNLAHLLNAESIAQIPGAGAAGGLGFGMMHFFNAQLRPGIDIVIESVHLRDRLNNATLCITGEGKLDASSQHGKTPIGVARLCQEMNIPCIAIAGIVEPDSSPLFARAISLSQNRTIEFAKANAAQLLESEAMRLIQEFPSR